MKILHTADLHLCSALRTNLPDERRALRRGELFDTFARMAEYATRQEYDAVIVAGDIFDDAHPPARILSDFLGVISAHPAQRYYCLGGNHEGNVFSACERLPENLFVFGDDWTYDRLGALTVAGRAVSAPDMEDTLSLPADGVNLVVLHGTLGTRSAPGGHISLSGMRGKSVDYMALGHYHSYFARPIDSRGVAVYAGTPEGRGYDECGACGFVSLSVLPGGIKHTFVPFAKRQIHDLSLSVPQEGGYAALLAAAGELLREIPSEDMVRVRLRGVCAPERTADAAALVRRYSSCFFSFCVEDETCLDGGALRWESDLTLRGEFARAVLADDSLSEEDRKEILRMGLRALQGEEI